MVRGRSVEHTRNTVKSSARCRRRSHPIEANGSRHAERGEDEHAPAQEREKCDTRPTVAAPDPMYIYITRSHIRDYGATDAQDARGSKQASQCHTTMTAGRSGRGWKMKRVVKD